MTKDEYISQEEAMYENYPLWKKSLAAKERLIEKLKMLGAPNDIQSIGFDAMTQGGGRDDTLDELEKFSVAVGEYQNTKVAIETVEDIFSKLSASAKQIIELIYFKNKTIEAVGQELGLFATSSVYERKQKALYESATIHHGSDFSDAVEK